MSTSTKPTIHERMAAVMRDVHGVEKASHNQQGNYKYAGHEAVTEALRVAYVKHGIVRIASVNKAEIVDKGNLLLTVEVVWIASDLDTSVDIRDRMCSVNSVGLQSSVRKDGGLSPVQAGMALSYAVKNAEVKCFSLTGDATPDPEAQQERDEVPSEAQALAARYLERFAACKTTAEVLALKEEIRGNWPAVKVVPGFSERMLSAIREASNRVKP